MTDSLILLDMFVRGIAVGAVAVMGLTVWRSGVKREVQAVTVATTVSVIAWLITESHALWAALGHAYLLVVPAYPSAALFWLLVVTVFEDRRLNAANLAPAAVLVVTGFICEILPPQAHEWLWAARNLFSGGLCLHAMYVIWRGWSGDLIESRRRMRGLVLGVAGLFAVLNVALAFTARLDPKGPWLLFTAGWPLGGALFAVVFLAMGAAFLQARPGFFEAARRAQPVADTRAEAAERQLLAALQAAMAGEGWRREGLAIGDLARELGAPEHRLRRLINQRLGHRNFADFVNSFRIEAAKQRLADPTEARTTVAAIVFDLGYGSLGPFNRAFREATGLTPTEWRRQALADASPELKEAV